MWVLCTTNVQSNLPFCTISDIHLIIVGGTSGGLRAPMYPDYVFDLGSGDMALCDTCMHLLICIYSSGIQPSIKKTKQEKNNGLLTCVSCFPRDIALVVSVYSIS